MNPESQKVDSDNLSKAFNHTFASSAEIKEISRLAGDVSTRCYYRVYAKNMAKSLILQTSEPFDADLNKHPFLSMQSALREWGVTVPNIVAVDAARGWILMEDLSDEMLQGHLGLDLYRDAIREMIVWIVRSCEPRSHQLHFRQAFDFEKLQAEMQHTATHLWQGLLNVDSREFMAAVAGNSQWLSDCPRFLCHRDYHSRNLMLRNGKLYVIDFQDARMGPVTYDIVSLLWDPYVTLDEKWRQEMLGFWKQNLDREALRQPRLASALLESSSGAPRWQVELERMKVQRLLKAAGSYAAFYKTRGRKDYLHCIRPSVEVAVHSLHELKRLGAFSGDDDKLLNLLQKLNLDGIDILVQRS
ncbi:MAG: phosphotransferase [Bdellovibrionales bacterium]|nr:phosphotransferase [Bdellovibrionales bacterium]